MLRLAAMLAVSSLLIAGCASRLAPTTYGIRNFRQVEPGIWRGGQPGPEGWAYLKSLGITNVIKLNEGYEGSDAPAVALGMTVTECPVSIFSQVIGGQKKSFRRAVAAIRPGGTYIHCTHGQDRTGVVVACYRMRQGWSKAEAEKEMMDLGFHITLQGLYGYWLHQQPQDWLLS